MTGIPPCAYLKEEALPLTPIQRQLLADLEAIFHWNNKMKYGSSVNWDCGIDHMGGTWVRFNGGNIRIEYTRPLRI